MAEDVRVIHGDCLEVLPTLVGVDAVVTDPPYGMDWNTDSTRFSGVRRRLRDAATPLLREVC
jgi:site-specific DNA-methyltransferase (adenine-specific)